MKSLRRAIHRFVRSLVVTPREEAALAWAHSAAPHAELIAERADLLAAIEEYRRALAAAAAADIALDEVRRALEHPQRFLPTPEITPAEARSWEAFMTGPLGVKIDTAMINWTQQQTQAACLPGQTQRDYAAGFARGAVVAWQMAKTLSRLVLANEHTPETDSSTAEAGLEHHQP
jgi:hypothetical protein